MSLINWPEVLAIFLGFGAFFIYMMNRLDSLRKELKSDIKSLENKIDGVEKNLKSEIKDLDKKVEGLEKDINRVYSKVSNIEGQITQMTRPNIVPFDRHYNKHHKGDDIKEN